MCFIPSASRPTPTPILPENFAHREDVRRTLNSSKEWREYVDLAAELVTEPVGSSGGRGGIV